MEVTGISRRGRRHWAWATAIAVTLALGLLAGAASAATPAWPTSWRTASASPVPRFESAIGTLGGKVYSFGGFTDSAFHVTRSYASYDPAANTWTRLGTLPAGMAETHLGVAPDGVRYIYFAGGFGGDLQQGRSPSQWISDQLWRYDTTNNTWSLIGRLPQARGAGALDLVDNKLHYFGGNPADRHTNVGDHWVYDLDTQQWSSAAPMPDPKDHFSSAVIGTKIYAIGGEHGHDVLHQQMPDVHVYDATTDTWTRLADLPMAKSHTEGGTFVTQGKIIMAGGQVDNFQPTNQVVSYDPATNAWSVLSPLPAQRQGTIVQRIGRQVVFAIGGNQTDEPRTETWLGQLALPPDPTSTSPPVAGTIATRGVPQDSRPGTWSGASTVGDQWQRCTTATDAAACTDIPGAAAVAYTPTADDVGLYLRLVETASNDGGSTTVASATTAQVANPLPSVAASVSASPHAATVAGAAGAASTRCAVVRTVRLRWTRPRHRRLTRVVVWVDGVRLATLSARRTRVTIPLPSLPDATRVTIRAVDTSRRTLSGSRTFRGCGTPAGGTLRLQPLKRHKTRS